MTSGKFGDESGSLLQYAEYVLLIMLNDLTIPFSVDFLAGIVKFYARCLQMQDSLPLSAEDMPLYPEVRWSGRLLETIDFDIMMAPGSTFALPLRRAICRHSLMIMSHISGEMLMSLALYDHFLQQQPGFRLPVSLKHW